MSEAFLADDELGHVAWLRLMAWGADPVLYPEDVRRRFGEIALDLERKTRTLDELADESREETQNTEAKSREWRQARNEAIASGKVVPLPRLTVIWEVVS